MKPITSTVSHVVPGWNFCNSDNLAGGELTHLKCKFCVKDKDGYKCLLYNTTLSSEGKFVDKTPGCIDATARGRGEAIQQPDITVDPKRIIKQTIDTYEKTYNDLVNQGYPPELARKVAKEYTLGN